MNSPSSRIFVAFLLLAGVVKADDAPSPPDGCTKVDTVGKITIFTTKPDFPGKSSCADLKDELQGIWTYYSKQYGLEKETLVAGGPAGGLLSEVKRDKVVLVVFPTVDEYESWVKRAGTGGITFHVGKYFNVVGIPMPDGKLTDEFLGVLWHEMSHVFFNHHVLLGSPEWLNEGLAEYFHLKSKGKLSPAPPARKEALDRLAKLRQRKATTPLKTLLTSHGESFGRQQYDEAWVLAHLLMTEATEQLNTIVSILADLEASAWANLEGVQSDVEKLALDLVGDLFGGPDRLQAAWDEHLSALLDDPESPKHLKTPPKQPKMVSVTPSIDIRIGGAAERKIDEKTTMLMRRPRGDVTFRAPWEASEFEVVFAVGDEKGVKWSDTFSFIAKTTAKPNQKFEMPEQYIPHYRLSKKAAAMVIWKIKGGGEYRTIEVWEYR